jgi:hypothetical protein
MKQSHMAGVKIRKRIELKKNTIKIKMKMKNIVADVKNIMEI